MLYAGLLNNKTESKRVRGKNSEFCSKVNFTYFVEKIRFEEIYFDPREKPLRLLTDSPALHILQQIRDEAHRFGITFHRNKRSKAFINSELNSIIGVGEKTTQMLIRDFNSVKSIKKQKLDALIESVGKSKAHLVFNHFHKYNLQLLNYLTKKG